jgi:hypothetical protein
VIRKKRNPSLYSEGANHTITFFRFQTKPHKDTQTKDIMFSWLWISIMLLLGLCHPTHQKSIKAPTTKAPTMSCTQCREKWSWLIFPSCSHCDQTSISGKCSPILNLDHCDFNWQTTGTERCMTLSGLTCHSLVKQGELAGQPAQENYYGFRLISQCGPSLQKCMGDTFCSESYHEFVEQAQAGGISHPDVYCEIVGGCSQRFRDVAHCAASAAEKAACSSNADCPHLTHTCDIKTGLCKPLVCCSDLTNPSCCGCIFGGLSSEDFCLNYCDNTALPRGVVVPPSCCSKCQLPRNSEAPSGCIDDHGNVRDIGDTWTEGCNICVCSPSGVPQCSPKPCVNTPPCPSEFWQVRDGQCCPECSGCEEIKGVWHHIGDSWTRDDEDCTCSATGHIHCHLGHVKKAENVSVM